MDRRESSIKISTRSFETVYIARIFSIQHGLINSICFLWKAQNLIMCPGGGWYSSLIEMYISIYLTSRKIN